MPDLSTSPESADMDTSGLFRRKAPTISGPHRGAGTLLRAPEFAGGAAGGVPLVAGEDAVVHVVRMAYKVASAQVERSTRLARRLRESGDRMVGPGSQRQALDGVEKLVMDSVLSGLEWWEGSVVEGRCPVKRLVAAEYQLIGTLLGLSGNASREKSSSAPADRTAASPQPGASAAAQMRPAAAARTPPTTLAPLQIKLNCERKDRRLVALVRWDLVRPETMDGELFFDHESGDGALLPATLVPPARAGDHAYLLVFDTAPIGRKGLWQAVICDRESLVIGSIDICL